MRTIQPHTLGIFLGLLQLCSLAAADSTNAQLPTDVTLNKDAGRGSYLFVIVRLERGEMLPFIVDTGTPVTLLAKLSDVLTHLRRVAG